MKDKILIILLILEIALLIFFIAVFFLPSVASCCSQWVPAYGNPSAALSLCNQTCSGTCATNWGHSGDALCSGCLSGYDCVDGVCVVDTPPPPPDDPDDPACDYSEPGQWMVNTTGECDLDFVITTSANVSGSGDIKYFTGIGDVSAGTQGDCVFDGWELPSGCCKYEGDASSPIISLKDADADANCSLGVKGKNVSYYISVGISVSHDDIFVFAPEAEDKISCPDDCKSKDRNITLVAVGCKSSDCSLESEVFDHWEYTSTSDDCVFSPSGNTINVNFPSGQGGVTDVDAIYVSKEASCKDCKANITFVSSLTAPNSKINHPGGSCPPTCEYSYNPSSNSEFYASIASDPEDDCSDYYPVLYGSGSCCEGLYDTSLFDPYNSGAFFDCLCGANYTITAVTSAPFQDVKLDIGLVPDCSTLKAMAISYIDDVECNEEEYLGCSYSTSVDGPCSQRGSVILNKDGCILWEGDCCLPPSATDYSTSDCPYKECLPEGYCESIDDCEPKYCKKPECINGKCEYTEIKDCEGCTEPSDCDDSDECTTDECLPDATCKNTVFINAELGCTDEPCETDGDCDDGDDGTLDGCSDGGKCEHEPKDGTSDCETASDCQSFPCKSKDCNSGKCYYNKIDECCQSPSDCQDGNDCTKDECISEKCMHTSIPDCESDQECDPCEELAKIVEKLKKLDDISDKLDKLDKLDDIKDLIQSLKDVLESNFKITNDTLKDINDALVILNTFDPDLELEDIVNSKFDWLSEFYKTHAVVPAVPDGYKHDQLTGPVPIWGVTEFLDKVLTDNYVIQKINGSSVELSNPVCCIPIDFGSDSYLESTELSMCEAEAGLVVFGDILVMIVTFSSFVMIFIGGRD